jgi:hypothetical protein
MKIRILLISLIIAALPAVAFADDFGTSIQCEGTICHTGTAATEYTLSTKNIYDTSYASASQQVDTFSTEIIGLMQGGSILYDQTFNAAFTDAQVQAYIAQVEGSLTGSGASLIIGPTLLSDSTSLVSSIDSIGTPVVTSTDVSFPTTTYVGPQTINFNDNQSWTLDIAAGYIVFDTLVTSIIHQTITTTTTDTYLTTDVYELVGVPSATNSVPEPTTMLLLGLGLIGLAGARRKIKK